MTTFTADPLRVPRGLRNGLMLSAVLWAGLLGAAFAEEPQCFGTDFRRAAVGAPA